MVGGERLCKRECLAANPLADVNMDGVVSPVDALVLINDLNMNGVGEHDLVSNRQFTFLDVNRDGMRTPGDVLRVVNILNSDGVREVEYGGHRNFTDLDDPFVWLDYNNDGWITDADTEAAVDYLMANGETDNDVFATAPNWFDGNLDDLITRTDAWGPEMWIRTYGYTEYPLPETQSVTLDAYELGGPYSNMAVENANGIVLGSFEITAYGGNTNLTTVEYATAEGSAYNIEYGYLKVDSDGDGNTDLFIGETTARDSEYFTFDIGYPVNEGEYVKVEFLADVAGSLDENASIRVELCALGGEVMEDGASLDGWSIGHYGQTLWEFEPHGDLFVTESFVPSSQMLLGTEAGHALELNLRADGGEASDVYELQFTSVTDTRSVDYFNIYTLNRESNDLIGRATIGACGFDEVPIPGQTFCLNTENGQLVVPPGETYTVYVVPQLKNDVQGGISGEELQVGIGATGVGYEYVGQGAVKVRGDISSNDYSVNVEGSTNGVVIGHDSFGQPNEAIVGEPHELYGSKIDRITTVVQTPVAAMPTGWADVLQLRIGAADNDNSKNGLNDRIVNGLIVPFESEGVLLGPRAYLYNAADSSILASSSGIYDANGNLMQSDFVTNGEYYMVFDGLRDNDVNTEIDRNSRIDLIMAVDFQDPQVDPARPSMFQARFDHHTRPMPGGFRYGESHLETIDVDAMTEVFSHWVDDLQDHLLEGTWLQS